VQKRPSQIDPEGTVHEALQRRAQKNVSADEMRRLRLLLSKERNRWLDSTGTDTGAAANSELSSPSH